MTGLLLLSGRIGSPVLGILLPAIIFLVSFWVAWALFKHFTKE